MHFGYSKKYFTYRIIFTNFEQFYVIITLILKKQRRMNMFIYLMMIDSPEDQSKFEKIYLTYKGLMYYIAYKILNNEHDAEDAVHSAFIKIAENIGKIDDLACPKTKNYITTIVENKAIDFYRANQRRNSDLYLDEISGIEVEETRVHGLAACMAKLPPRYRQVILLKYYHGFSCKEIAKQLKLTKTNFGFYLVL